MAHCTEINARQKFLLVIKVSIRLTRHLATSNPECNCSEVTLASESSHIGIDDQYFHVLHGHAIGDGFGCKEAVQIDC